MICVSLQNKNLEELLNILERQDVEMAEIRLDRCQLSDEDIRELFEQSAKPLIATCRIEEAGAKRSEQAIMLAMEAGAQYADLEIEAPEAMSKRIQRAAREVGTTFIRSYHNFDRTPDRAELEQIISRCQRYGAQVIKIVTTAVEAKDVTTMESLYDYDREGKLVAFCMGAAGSSSRVDCLKWGAPFSYAALEKSDATAPGQLSLAEMRESLYKDFTFFHKEGIKMPASKSVAQRAIVAASLSEGVSHLSGYSQCGDSEAAIAACRSIGAKIKVNGSELEIKGIGPVKEPLKLEKLNTGESGLLTRLMIPVMAMINGDSFVIEGEKTLVKRPLRGANEIMAAFGVILNNLEKQSKEVFVPMKVNGKLLPGRADISGKDGSQLISGLLTALPMADKNSTIYVHYPKSIPYMFLTMDVLKKFGIRISNEMEGDEIFLETQDWNYCTGTTFRIKGGQTFKATDMHIEGDWSSAVAFVVAGAVFGSVQIEGLDLSSLQADLSVLDILVEAGADVAQNENGALEIHRAPLSAISVDMSNAPDLFPIISVLACFCPGRNYLSGVSRLANKESDRAAAILGMLEQMGVEAFVENDKMIITGHSLEYRLLNGMQLKGGNYTSHHDHRMAMALQTASLCSSEPIIIDDTQCAAKSFPDFFELFNS